MHALKTRTHTFAFVYTHFLIQQQDTLARIHVRTYTTPAPSHITYSLVCHLSDFHLCLFFRPSRNKPAMTSPDFSKTSRLYKEMLEMWEEMSKLYKEMLEMWAVEVCIFSVNEPSPQTGQLIILNWRLMLTGQCREVIDRLVMSLLLPGSTRLVLSLLLQSST